MNFDPIYLRGDVEAELRGEEIVKVAPLQAGGPSVMLYQQTPSMKANGKMIAVVVLNMDEAKTLGESLKHLFAR